jgi:hypothetical protein
MNHDDYLERAQEYLKLAGGDGDTELKASLTQTAVQWEQLAAGHRLPEFSNPNLPWIPHF